MYLSNRKYSKFWGERNWASARRFLCLFATLIVVTCPLESWSQSKFFTTSNRGGVAGAKQNAQIQQLYFKSSAQESSITFNANSVNDVSGTISNSIQCGNAGRMFAPDHALSVDSCISSVTANADGTVTFSGGIVIGSAGLCDPSVEGALRYNGTDKVLEFCDGADWSGFGSGGAAPLYSGVHNSDDCTVQGGNVYTVSGGDQICQISASSCPAGWTQLSSWSETTSKYCAGTGSCPPTNCTTGSHLWADTCREACNYYSAGCYAWGTCQANITKIGCY